MREDFERKLTKNEFDNLMERLNKWFKPKLVIKVFEWFMESGSYTWKQYIYTNKIGLLYKTHADIMLYKTKINQKDIKVLRQMIDAEQGTEKQYFLYTNFHKQPQMWRLEDNKCIWGKGVHESYQPLRGKYFAMLEEFKEKERKERRQIDLYKLLVKYIDGYPKNSDELQEVELEEWEMNTRNYS